MNNGVTNKFRIARLLTASAVLLDGNTLADDAAVNSAVLGRVSYLIQEIWQETYPTLKHRWQINDFWRRVHTQVMRSEDVVGFVTDFGLQPNPTTPWGFNVRLELRTDRGTDYHAIHISAKKD